MRWSGRRRDAAPIPLGPRHRRTWRGWRLWCSCGLRWAACPDRHAPPPTEPPAGAPGPARNSRWPGRMAGATARARRNDGARATTTAQHLPLRPLWLCRACAAPWPCAPARLALLREYADDRVALLIHLAGLLHEATTQLYTLNPHDAPEPAQLFARFLGWARSRSPS
ncbi:hypothetical protein ACFYMB_10125 [Micromonospora haikouensis]|uniref:hypothetical protein n=1 Tax=Micromonospora haikouensis TaxID=686309 RepID=UPI0036AE7C97